jgi:hypothetical protein
VQLKLGTRHKTYSMHMIGRDKAESTWCSVQSAVKVKRRLNLPVTRDETHVIVGGMLALG